ncbi:endonuclease/exonuclease/phosphatase family protein [Photobacterium minamisatsumaniensis]|uniref:endonuclease/exonuclease/phosphatase family protein n=1 Tax=Photobacterium minamisatsumaniensis TaxID=2910233 RepID=UPI003D0CDCCD
MQHISAPTEKTASNQYIKIATFNLCNFIEPPDAFYDFENIYTNDQWQKKKAWIVDYLAQHQPDVIGFQEVFSPDALKNLLQEAGYPYFSTVDKPQKVDDYVYQSPVVAIASKFPIQSAASVSIDDLAETSNAAQKSVTQERFDFSRRPLRATIQIPHIGLCDCYVVHFKSKRPMVEPTLSNNQSDPIAKSRQAHALDLLSQELLGGWASSCQRGTEAALLLQAMINRKAELGYPAILMGDFNDDLHTGVLSHLLTGSTRQLSPQENEALLGPYRFNDSWSLLQRNLNHNEPFPSAPYTFYYGAKGQVLDYILLSREFDATYHESLAEVYDYQLHDKHLVNPSYKDDSCSTDHAIVMVSLKIRD